MSTRDTMLPRTLATSTTVEKDQEGRTNFTQRLPHESKEMLENLKGYSLLAEAYSDIFEYIRVVLEKRHPDTFGELRIFADILPMNAASPAYPFTGFVLNLRVSTWGHRDHGDKRICIVIPLGDYSNGELCLYEVGLMFDLKMGDVLLFPSCDITHFNMHFSGKRGTIVLHSDRQGDQWSLDFRGWGAYINHVRALS
ncbi:hypothetical protein C8F04DRAFT_971370 [Mycena alexandri]|uniref:Uncharacterized protein n=1 Tax=Mycena alexandri TaxID=1745969 RepID=A0AAD6WRK1_9AGAR|nr:hypothetical protein C8F04DRAFT_971370 [Mycena alexandri]